MIIGTRGVFQGKMPLIPIKLKELIPTSGKKPKGEERYKEPRGKWMSLIGKGIKRAKESHGEQPQGKLDRKDKALSMQIDQVDHVKGTDCYSEDIKQISKQKIIYSETGGHVLTPFFGKQGQKGVRRSSRWKTDYKRPIEGREERSTKVRRAQP
jgi:hypothetical protein